MSFVLPAGTSLAVPGFLNQFDHDDQADAAKVPPASDKPQTEEEKAAALAQKEARENALARHAAARAAKEAQQAAEDAAKVVTVLPSPHCPNTTVFPCHVCLIVAVPMAVVQTLLSGESQNPDSSRSASV